MFSIILVIYDPGDNFSHPVALPKVIESIYRLKGAFELIIVNNADPSACPKTTQYLRDLIEEKPDIKLVELDKNYGCAGGFNRAIHVVDKRSNMLVYMSVDALIVDPDTIIRIKEAFQNHPKIVAIHPLSVYEDFEKCNYSQNWSVAAFNRLLENTNYDKNNLPEEPGREIDDILRNVKSIKRQVLKYPMPQLPLTFYVIRRSAFNVLGGFNDEFIAGHENIDIALRALQNNRQSAILKNTFVFHRRMLFRILGQAGVNEPLREREQTSGKAKWDRVWNERTPDEIFCDLKYGVFFHRAFIRPAKKFFRRISRS